MYPYDCHHCGDSYNEHQSSCPEGILEKQHEQERKAERAAFIELLSKHGIMFTVRRSAYGSLHDVEVFNSDLMRFLQKVERS